MIYRLTRNGKILFQFMVIRLTCRHRAIDLTSPLREWREMERRPSEGHFDSYRSGGRQGRSPLPLGCAIRFGIDFQSRRRSVYLPMPMRITTGSSLVGPTRVSHLVAGATMVGERDQTGGRPISPIHADNARPNLDIGKGHRRPSSLAREATSPQRDTVTPSHFGLDVRAY